MVNILISGFYGRMGQNVLASVKKRDDANVVCGVDIKCGNEFGIPVYDSYDKVNENVDVIIDFSSPKLLKNILNFAVAKKIAVVLATTGYTNDDLDLINEASKVIPVFKTANFSLGVNVLTELVSRATQLLKGFDIEIIEKHHNQKVDAPSGTALMLADAAKSANGDLFYTYGREGVVGKRQENEIGIHAVRGGNIVGEHDVLYAGGNEVITLSHHASSRSVFADGAVEAAIFVYNKPASKYDMKDVINAKL